MPETLQALIAARLDGLEPAERRILEDAAVLGKTFTTRALADRLGPRGGRASTRCSRRSSARRFSTVEADPRSPERGQYGFLHALFQKVAYDTLSRKERKARHLAVAVYLEDEWGPEEPEVVEVVASHYLEAYRASPDADDAAEYQGEGLRPPGAGGRTGSVAGGQ